MRPCPVVFVFVGLFFLASSVFAVEPEKRAPGPGATGEIFQWETGGEVVYQYYIPATYDGDAGANLTFLFHGANLDHTWGFANHVAGEFRADDIVVAPRGPTGNSSGGFNFRFSDKDIRETHAVHQDFMKSLRVRNTFVYGHGTGASFAFAYAGEHSEFVQGVLAHAGAVLIGTKAGKKQQHQAIAILHGAADPIAPLVGSARAREFYIGEGYPAVHLRVMRDGEHQPDPAEADRLLAWCEAMSHDDLRHVDAAFDVLLASESGPDPVAQYLVGQRVLNWGGGSPEVREKAEMAVDAIDQLAAKHISLIEKSMGRNRADKLDRKPWLGHFHLFMREFAGTPAADSFAKKWERKLNDHREAAQRAAETYRDKQETQPSSAFVAGIDILSRGFLASEYANRDLLSQLKSWKADARKLSISRNHLKYYDKVVPLFEKAIDSGTKAYDAVK